MSRSYYEIFEDWGIDPEEDRKTFKWLKEAQRDEKGRLTREVGIRRPGGVPEKLVRRHSMAGTQFYCLKESNALYPLFTGNVSVSRDDFHW